VKSGGSNPAILDIFLTLRVSVAQLRLYPKESPQVLKVVTDTHHAIHSFLETENTLTVSKAPKGLLINGQPLSDLGQMADPLEHFMLAALSDAQVKSISFKKGLTLEELLTFLQAFTRKFWDIKDGKQINRRLREERVDRILVDEETAQEVGRLGFDQARQALGELARMLKEVEPAFHAPLRAVGKALSDAFRHDPRLWESMNTVLPDQAGEEASFQTAVKAGEADVVTRANTILQMADEEKIQALLQEGIALLDELSALDQAPLMTALLTSLIPMLLDQAAGKRLSVGRAINNLRHELERGGAEGLLDSFDLPVRTALDVERDPGVYAILADMTGFIADLRIRNGNMDRAQEGLALLNRHYQIKELSFSQRGDLAHIALERIASGVGCASLFEKVRAGDSGSAKIIEALDAAAARFLIQEIKNGETPARRMHFASFLPRMGTGAVTLFLEEIQKTLAPSDVLHLIEVLPHTMAPDRSEMALGGLLRHVAVAVRRRAGTMLVEQAFPRAGGLLLDALNGEADAFTRLTYVDCLGRLRHRGAVEMLSLMVDSRNHPDDLRCAACIALGRIGDVRAVTALSHLYLKGEKGLTKVFHLVPPAVRAAAAGALASFPTNKEARDALWRANEDHDPAVRALADQALCAPLRNTFGEIALGVRPLSSAARMEPGMKVGGLLQEVPLESLCRKIAQFEGTGVLKLGCNGSLGGIFFDAGLVIAADFEGRRDHESFVLMAGCREGVFLFQPGEATPERRILTPVDALFQDLQRAKTAPPSA
jgi:hypothetical protein